MYLNERKAHEKKELSIVALAAFTLSLGMTTVHAAGSDVPNQSPTATESGFIKELESLPKEKVLRGNTGKVGDEFS